MPYELLVEEDHVIFVEVTPERDNYFRFTWSFPHLRQNPMRYAVRIDIVTSAANQAYDALHALLNEYLPSKSTPSTEEKTKSKNILLERLRIRGLDLFNAIFPSVVALEGPISLRTPPDVVKNKLLTCYKAEFGFRIQFREINLDNHHIPWGLVLDPSENEVFDTTIQIGDVPFVNFWATKYFVSAGMPAPGDIHDDSTGEGEFRLYHLHDAKLWQEQKAELFSQNKQVLYSLTERIEEEFGPVFEDPRKLLDHELFKRKDVHKRMIYSFAHSFPHVMELNHGEGLEPKILTEMSNLLSSLHNTYIAKRILFFLNGCHTAGGSTKDGVARAHHGDFMSLSTMAGLLAFDGLLGTREILPLESSFEFGLAVIFHLLQGSRLGEIIDKLWKDYWPLILVYEIRCDPNYRVAIDSKKTITPGSPLECVETETQIALRNISK